MLGAFCSCCSPGWSWLPKSSEGRDISLSICARNCTARACADSAEQPPLCDGNKPLCCPFFGLSWPHLLCTQSVVCWALGITLRYQRSYVQVSVGTTGPQSICGTHTSYRTLLVMIVHPAQCREAGSLTSTMEQLHT